MYYIVNKCKTQYKQLNFGTAFEKPKAISNR